VSKRYKSQILWLLANPLVVHGIGSKKTEKQWMKRLPIRLGGSANPISGSPFQPILKHCYDIKSHINKETPLKKINQIH